MAHDLQPETYAHLRRLAGQIHFERGGGPTLQPTALLHEAWMKISASSSTYKDRGHFLAVAARAMRQILVDHARAKNAEKRGPRLQRTTLTRVPDLRNQPLDLLELDGLIDELEKLHATAADIVVMRVFGGLTAAEAAEAKGVSKATADRAWRVGRAFLTEAMTVV